jgi:hypothetical protein
MRRLCTLMIVTLASTALSPSLGRSDDAMSFGISWELLDITRGDYVDSLAECYLELSSLKDEVLDAAEGDPQNPNDDWPAWAVGGIITQLEDAEDKLDSASDFIDDVLIYLSHADMWYPYSPTNGWN